MDWNDVDELKAEINKYEHDFNREEVKKLAEGIDRHSSTDVKHEMATWVIEKALDNLNKLKNA